MMHAQILSVWGTEVDVVDNARASMNASSSYDYLDDLSERDKGLIRYLKRGVPRPEFDDYISDLSVSDPETIERMLRSFKNKGEHWTPFANGIGAQFHITAPIPIMRQVFKTKVGTVESEVSRRYVSDVPCYHFPVFHKAAENVKQGSSDEPLNKPEIDLLYAKHLEASSDLYAHMIAEGVAPEEARFVLPQAMMTEARISNSLYGWARFYNLRSDQHAQRGIRELAEDVAAAMSIYFPISWRVLTDYEPRL